MKIVKRSAFTISLPNAAQIELTKIALARGSRAILRTITLAEDPGQRPPWVLVRKREYRRKLSKKTVEENYRRKLPEWYALDYGQARGIPDDLGHEH